MWLRQISSAIQATKKSVLLLGPRQVGKSTLIKTLKPDLSINLAVESEYFSFVHNSRELEDRLSREKFNSVFIDEIQRIPRLTNSIQAIVDENPKLKFFLTGSSARKLKKGRANLLPGRMVNFELGPLTIKELGKDWNENTALSFGTLPGVLNEKDLSERKRILKSYAQTYLKEEIVSESIVKNTESFARFLMASSRFAGHYLDLSKLAKASKSPRQNVVRHFEILEDTLLVNRVYPDPEMLEKGVDLIKHPRFFYFDVGVLNALLGSFDLSPDRIGPLFENLVYTQIRNLCLNKELSFEAFNFRTRGGYEVDFIFKIEGNYFAIECKSSEEVDDTAINKIKKIKEYYPKIKLIIVHLGEKKLSRNQVAILPLAAAIEEMGL